MGTIPASENVFPLVRLAEVAAPSTPPSGEVHLYAKSSGLLFWKDDAGTEYAINTEAAGGLAAHLADTGDAHDASAISIVDAGTHYTATDVEAALAEVYVAAVGGGIPASTIDGKGELLVGSANDAIDNLAVGADGTVLRAEAAQTLGVLWAQPRLAVTLGPWVLNDVPASATTQMLLPYMNTSTAWSQGGATSSDLSPIAAGRIVGAILISDASRTTGTAILKPRIATTPTSFNGDAVQLDGTSTVRDASFVTYANGLTYGSGALGVSIVTSSWGPTTANFLAWLVCLIDV